MIEFKPFHETYNVLTFFMSIGMIYPNPRTDKYRLAAIPLFVASVVPLTLVIWIDMYKSWQESDLINIIRHNTILGPLHFGLFKMVLMYNKKIEAKQIMDEISRDHYLFNEFSEKYKTIATSLIRNSQKYSEKGLIITVIAIVTTFPLTAIILTLYNLMFKPEPIEYMIHDVRKPFDLSADLEDKCTSPYFDIMFAYMLYCSVLYMILYTGYDGFFGIAVNHACLKMELYCAALEDALKADSREVYGRVVGVIKEQIRMFKFVDLIQDTFNIWLGFILLAVMVQIGSCMYHVIEGFGFDIRYIVFVLGCVIYIYLPCRYAAKLKAMSVETATRFYCSGWEHVDNQQVRKMLLFMIARAQIPSEITAFGIMTFDMELFTSIMQTSYSMFTLLKS